MRKRTTTQKLQQAISNNLLHIVSAEKYSKNTQQSVAIDAETFINSLDFLCESVFADSLGWHYEKNYRTGQYIFDTRKMDGDADFVITVYLNVCDGVSREDVEATLLFLEDE